MIRCVILRLLLLIFRNERGRLACLCRPRIGLMRLVLICFRRVNRVLLFLLSGRWMKVGRRIVVRRFCRLIRRWMRCRRFCLIVVVRVPLDLGRRFGRRLLVVSSLRCLLLVILLTLESVTLLNRVVLMVDYWWRWRVVPWCSAGCVGGTD